MTFQQLQYLLEANTTGSISQAAKNLFLTPSSVSVAITNLESELGYPIFTRTPQGLTPTVRGERVIEYASRIFETYRLLNHVDQSTKRTIRINAADHDVFNIAFSKTLAEYRGKKDTSFCLSYLATEAVLPKLVLGELDLGLSFCFEGRSRQLETTLEKQGLAWQVVTTVPAAIRVGPNHRLYHATSVRPTDLEEETLVEPPSKTYSQDYFLQGLINFDPGRIIVCANNGASRRLIIDGLAYSIVPLMPDTVSDTFRLRRIPIEGINFHLFAITNPKYPTPSEVNRYLDILAQELKRK